VCDFEGDLAAPARKIEPIDTADAAIDRYRGRDNLGDVLGERITRIARGIERGGGDGSTPFVLTSRSRL
jgi:hypothetical protein